ncbi:MAG: VIT and VWA domain-containing protein [Gemmatimonadaceae bacterium]|nr:VIT and VWA domain-containing protein [Gemmatimonadaceae bacterium]
MRYRPLHLLAALLTTAAAVDAQGLVEPVTPLPRPVPPRVGEAVGIVASDVMVEIEGREARITVDDRLRNTGVAPAEARWLFPLPRDAAFTGFTLWNGETALAGEMLDRDRAQAIYEAIVRRRRDPALLTLAGHGMVRSQVFPIAPGEERRVRLRTVQLLDRAGDALRFRYRLPRADHGAATTLAAARTLAVTILDRAGDLADPWSPTHPLRTRRERGRVVVTVDAATGGDVELLLPRRRPLAALGHVVHAPRGEDGYAMLVVAPPHADHSAAVPRDLTLVVDVSGSMSGAKLEQARAGLQQALGTLGPRDRFRIVAFASTVREFRPGFATADGEALDEARRFVDALHADGGTNLDAALAVALRDSTRRPTDASERLPIALVLTDGIPSVGEHDPEKLAAAAEGALGRTRVFTLGVGADVNTFLLDRLAQAGRGRAEYVVPGAEVETTLGTLFRRIARPVLTDLRLVAAPVALSLREPAALPDLFDGDELVLFARYRGAGRGPLVLEGTRDGRRERIAIEADFPAVHEGDDFVARLWATAHGATRGSERGDRARDPRARPPARHPHRIHGLPRAGAGGHGRRSRRAAGGGTADGSDAARRRRCARRDGRRHRGPAGEGEQRGAEGDERRGGRRRGRPAAARAGRPERAWSTGAGGAPRRRAGVRGARRRVDGRGARG